MPPEARRISPVTQCDASELKDILKAREPFYRQAHLHLMTSGRTADQSFQELLQLLESE